MQVQQAKVAATTKRIFKQSVIALLLAGAAGAASAADWSDAYIGYTYGEKYKEPGNAADVQKDILTLSYVGGYKYGVNFFTLDMLTSDNKNPAHGSSTGSPSERGAQEVYVVYSNTLSLSKVTGKPMKFGPIRDIGIQAGFDYNSKNDTFGAGLIKYIAGPKVEFDVPGLLTLGLFYYKENNNNGISGKDVSFDPTYRVATVWSFNFDAGLPAVFKGFANYTGEKGKDGFGGDTAAETWLDTGLLWDVGSAAGTPKTFYAGVGYQYIKNKFGNQPSLAGSKISTPQIKLEAHF